MSKTIKPPRGQTDLLKIWESKKNKTIFGRLDTDFVISHKAIKAQVGLPPDPMEIDEKKDLEISHSPNSIVSPRKNA